MDIQKIQRILAPILQPLAYPYAYIARTRRQLYSCGYKKGHRPRSVTISVGNIAAGGTGKTPLTGWILNWAENNGYGTVVLTRGYGGKTGPYPLIVTPSTKAYQCGDEPLLLARNHPKATVIAFPKRKVSIKLAEKYFSPDLVVLDDGMQHLAIQRDIDLVVLKENDLDAGWNKVIPYGEWREDVSALKVADAFFIKASPERFAALESALLKRLESFNKPIFSFELQLAGLTQVHGFTPGSCHGCHSVHKPYEERAVKRIPHAKLFEFGPYVLVTGVGEPDQVLDTAVQNLGQLPSASYYFPDHHAFSTADLAQIQQHKLPVVCTEKDAVKLEQFFFSVPFYYLDVEVSFGPSLLCDMAFTDWLARRYATSTSESTPLNV